MIGDVGVAEFAKHAAQQVMKLVRALGERCRRSILQPHLAPINVVLTEERIVVGEVLPVEIECIESAELGIAQLIEADAATAQQRQ